ncbi:MAG: hypothetical protein JWM59_5155 [Verrucomicrobiales bacterium]|nr:hypothetical protein [Verrucomicrobiales bacterium]
MALLPGAFGGESPAFPAHKRPAIGVKGAEEVPGEPGSRPVDGGHELVLRLQHGGAPLASGRRLPCAG